MNYPINNNYPINTVQKYYPKIEDKKKNTSIITIIFSRFLSPSKVRRADEITITNNLRGGKKFIIASNISGKSKRNSFTRKEVQHAYPLNKKNMTKLVKSLNYDNDFIVDSVLEGMSSNGLNNINNSYPKKDYNYKFESRNKNHNSNNKKSNFTNSQNKSSFDKSNVIDAEFTVKSDFNNVASKKTYSKPSVNFKTNNQSLMISHKKRKKYEKPSAYHRLNGYRIKNIHPQTFFDSVNDVLSKRKT